jgi:GT2 family glycosyltransferase
MGDWDRRSEREVDVVSGMFMLLRRDALEQVGVLDEAYFVYAEEADLCFRLWRHGWRCVFTPEARILQHEGGGKSTRQVSARMYVELQKSLLVFQRKHYGPTGWACGKAMFVGAMAARASVWAIAGALGATSSGTGRAAVAALRFHLLGRVPKAI